MFRTKQRKAEESNHSSSQREPPCGIQHETADDTTENRA